MNFSLIHEGAVKALTVSEALKYELFLNLGFELFFFSSQEKFLSMGMQGFLEGRK